MTGEIPKNESALSPKPTSKAAEVSQGVHLGCGAQALAIIIILLLAQFSNKFFYALAAIGLLQLIYMLPSVMVMKSLNLGQNVTKGFWATAWVIAIFNVIGLLIWKLFWPL